MRACVFPGDHAGQLDDVAPVDARRGDAEGAGAAQRDARLVQRAQRLLPGRPEPRARLVRQHPALHAHAAARLPQQELHQARAVRQVLPQPRARADAAQPLPVGVPRLRLHLVPDQHDGRAAAALPR